MAASLGACAALPQPVAAPLPPGIRASKAEPVAGLYIHVSNHSSWQAARRPGQCASGVTDLWFYRSADRGVVYSRKRPCEGEAPSAMPSPVFTGANRPMEFEATRPTCGPEPAHKCSEGRVSKVPVRCWLQGQLASVSVGECVSVDWGRTRGLVLARWFITDDGQGDDFDVDQVDDHALIDPVVFEKPH